MLDSVLSDEAILRLSIFLVVFAVFAIWEFVAPCRTQQISKVTRWLNNILISALNVFVTRVLTPVTVVFTAVYVQNAEWGLLNVLELPEYVAIILALIFFDFAIYVQHVIFHKVEFLWRLHRMHHADLEFDVTTAIRFHPIEVVLSMLIKIGIVTAIGAPVIAVVIFEVLLNASSLFNHANIRVPKAMDAIIRLFIVTPDMHRVHHSIIRLETDSNFGFNLPWWDYIFKTYRAQPQQGHLDMTIGIERFRDSRELWLDRLLMQPFRKAD